MRPGWIPVGGKSEEFVWHPHLSEWRMLNAWLGWHALLVCQWRLLSPKEAQDLFPLMALDGVVGAAYTPNDGVIDPTGLTNALAAGAKSRGASFFMDTDVEQINLENGRVSEVVTNRGTIKTEIVVNAAGQWGGEVGKLVGLNLPVVPMAHLYIITKPIEGVGHDFPTLHDPDLLVYWREEVGGLITGGYEHDPAPFGLDGIPKDFKYQLLAPDWDRFAPLMENSINAFLLLSQQKSSTLLMARRGFTPDGEFLLGPTEVKGFWVASAFCAHGLAGAGGIGKVMAEWIIDGHPEWDLWRLDRGGLARTMPARITSWIEQSKLTRCTMISIIRVKSA